jgi:MFS family permease
MKETATRSRAGHAPSAGHRPSARRVGLLVLAVGTTVANIYYVQPLLPQICHALGVCEGTTVLLVTTAQIGYALALALVVPVGDLTERRRLVTGLLAATALTCALAAAAPRSRADLRCTGPRGHPHRSNLGLAMTSPPAEAGKTLPRGLSFLLLRQQLPELTARDVGTPSSLTPAPQT